MDEDEAWLYTDTKQGLTFLTIILYCVYSVLLHFIC